MATIWQNASFLLKSLSGLITLDERSPRPSPRSFTATGFVLSLSSLIKEVVSSLRSKLPPG